MAPGLIARIPCFHRKTKSCRSYGVSNASETLSRLGGRLQSVTRAHPATAVHCALSPRAPVCARSGCIQARDCSFTVALRVASLSAVRRNTCRPIRLASTQPAAGSAGPLVRSGLNFGSGRP
jgi:hypothetical protein